MSLGEQNRRPGKAVPRAEQRSEAGLSARPCALSPFPSSAGQHGGLGAILAPGCPFSLELLHAGEGLPSGVPHWLASPWLCRVMGRGALLQAGHINVQHVSERRGQQKHSSEAPRTASLAAHPAPCSPGPAPCLAVKAGLFAAAAGEGCPSSQGRSSQNAPASSPSKPTAGRRITNGLLMSGILIPVINISKYLSLGLCCPRQWWVLKTAVLFPVKQIQQAFS